MKLHELPKINTSTKAKRLGRGTGSGAGEKCGRGFTRHQKARENIPLGFEGGQGKLTKKFPLLRGKGKNKSVHTKPMIVQREALKNVPKDTEITVKYLVDNNFLDKKALKLGFKIIGKVK